MTPDLITIAKYLTKTQEEPLKVRIDADASLVVIAHNGMKFRFSGYQIAQAEKALKLPPTHAPKASKTSAASKTPASEGGTKQPNVKDEPVQQDGKTIRKTTARKPPAPKAPAS